MTGFNSFQFADDIPAALREAGRVTKPGGHVAMCVWGSREQCESFATTISAIMALGPPPPASTRPPLSTPGVIEELMGQAKTVTDTDQLVEIMKECQSILTEQDPPVIYLGQTRMYTVLNPKIQGFLSNPLYLETYFPYTLSRAQ